MKVHLSITLFFTMLFTSVLVAQDLQGIATYKTQRKVDIELDSTQFNDEMQERMMAMLKKQFEKTYNLEFTATESVYKEEEGLDNPSNTVNSGGMMLVVAGTGGSDVLYKNTAENRFVNQTEVLSKQFLVKDAIEEREWTLEKETKNIGEYTCFKATAKRTVTMMSSFSSSDGAGGDAEESKEEEIEQTITAWYTPQIPVKTGPGQYGGLPGLILEVSDGSETILCSKIVLNPKNGVSIKEPSKGKEVTQEEYEVIMEEKMKEMNERYQSDGRRGGHSNSFKIRIGG